MSKLTDAKARKVLGIPPKGDFNEEMLQSAWREAAKVAHPDAGGTDAAMAQINAARDLLETRVNVGPGKTLHEVADYIENLARERGIDLNAPDPRTTRKPKPAKPSTVLTISPEGHLFGKADRYIGNCRSVAAAIAYCGACGWSYQQTAELTAGQRRVLEAA